MKLKSYPKYKNSGVEWLGAVPEHWGVKRIGHTTYVKGRVGWQGLTSDEFIDEGPYCVTGTDFINGKIDWKTSYHVDEKRYQEDPYIQLKENDLLVTKDGSIGKIAVVKQLNGKATLNSGIFLTRPLKDTYIADFMYWVLNSKVFTDFIDLSKTGTTISHLYQNVFVRFSFPLPTIPDQQTIVAFLNRETRRIDNLLDKKQKLVELLQEQRVALVSRAITKGLDASVKMKPSGVEWLGDVPEHWEVKKLKYVSDTSTGFAFSSDDYTDDGIPLIRIGDILQDGNIDIENAKKLPDEYLQIYQLAKIEKEDILMAMTGATIGKAGKYQFEKPGLLNQRVCKFFPISIVAKYLWYILKSEQYIEHIKLTGFGGAQPNISDAQLLDYYSAIPPLPEQKAIATFLDRETANIDGLVSKVETAIEKLKEYRTALISAAVTGKIDVRGNA